MKRFIFTALPVAIISIAAPAWSTPEPVIDQPSPTDSTILDLSDRQRTEREGVLSNKLSDRQRTEREQTLGNKFAVRQRSESDQTLSHQ